MLVIDKIKSLFSKGTPTISVDQLPVAGGPLSPNRAQYFDGDKFPGGFGETKLFTADYWTLRARSAQLFKENLYARGVLRRLITNEINTGLTLEAAPESGILGIDEDTLEDWANDVEDRHNIWAMNAQMVDYKEKHNFYQLQAIAKNEARVEGDLLVILHQDRVTALPKIELVSGGLVQTPIGGGNAKKGNKILHGVEIDARGRHVAFHILQEDGTYKRVVAYGERSKRRIAWLYYGSDKRKDDVRGEPFLALFLQSLKEIDRYRDSVQRKAVINSMLAMYIKKTQDKMGTLPVTGSAVKKIDGAVTDTDGTNRTYNLNGNIPGVVYEELQQGEEPVGFMSHGTDEKFSEFENAIVSTFAWACEIPPNIVKLAFSHNYSASQGEINEFRMYLNRDSSIFGADFNQPIYQEWLLSEVLQRRIDAPGLLQAWRNPLEYATFGAWLVSDWSGQVKPSTDTKKQAQGYELMTDKGWITHGRTSKEISGTKFTKNVKKLKKENEQLVEALRPLAEFKAEFNESQDDGAGDGDLEETVNNILDTRLEETNNVVAT